jgi:signal transduction histidine kinase/CheY-like chemotaxis protein
MKLPRRLSLRSRLMLVVLVTTAAGLLMSAAALLVYELRLYRSNWIDDLRTQANLIAYASAPALAFDDVRVARQNLDSLRAHPLIEAAAIYRADGQLFASYAADPNRPAPYPQPPPAPQHRFAGGDLELFERIVGDGEALGTVYLRARYDVLDRLRDYLLILAGVTLLGLALAALVFQRLQHAVMQPILQLTRVAHDVIERRDYSHQVPKSTEDEIGVLVDAFNDMLAEVGRRTDALEHADRRKDEFLATLAHELRNPLAPLTTALEIIKRADADPEARRRAREIMERQTRQMVRLIDDLLEVSRISTGKLQLVREPVDLIAVLRSAVEITEPAFVERRHTLTRAWPAQPLWVDGDTTRLAQVFANLLHNAARYTDPGGAVRVEAEARPDEGVALVRVIDNGIGIDPSMQQGIFEMFAQVDKSLERGRAGLGVGLTLARQLVQLHGGRIDVASAGLGQGAEFTVTLPLREAPPQAASVAGPTESATPAEAPSMQVLIADDNVDFAASLGAMLQAAGHDVQVVHDGGAAFDAAVRARPQVGLFDIGMPRVNGYDLARRLRERRDTRDMLLVAISGWGQESDRKRSRLAGFDHHLIKPVELDRLLQVMRDGRR